MGQPVILGASVPGGDIAQPRHGTLSDGTEVFVKSGQDLPAGMLPVEAKGLALLSQGGCRVPDVLAVNGDWLVLEWIQRTASTVQSQADLGRGLAAQHQISRELCGLEMGNFIGLTPQSNTQTGDWVGFFAEQRLGTMQRSLRQTGQLSVAEDSAIDLLKGRLMRWMHLPEEPHVLLHGDLWGGNTMAGPQGEPVVFDPAVYFGCRESDLAMTRLFGGFSSAFYDAYEEVLPLSSGFEERVDLYNLYHLLNHALMFGGGYLSQSMAVVGRYVG
jgi:protein-ribulosamine 3-kinase